MKRYFAFILFLGFGLNASFGQIDQKNLRLSSYIKIHFPYEDVKENFCSDQFVGLFYVSFQIDKNGQCYDINFYGIENLKVISALTKLMQKENTRFDTSFAKKMFQKKLLQPIFYSYSNCVQDSLAHFKAGFCCNTPNWFVGIVI